MLKDNLKKVRLEMGLSIAKFAEKIDIPAMTLTKYERGERTPSAQLFVQLYKKLNVNMNWFVSGEGNVFNTDIKNSGADFEIKVKNILKKEGLI